MSALDDADAMARQDACLPESPWIIRDDVRIAWRRAEDIEAAAYRRADELLSRATAEADGIRESARHGGVREGAVIAGRLIADTEKAVAAFRCASEGELVPLAFAIAHRILGAFPEDDRLLRAVRTALDEHQGTSGLRLRADPQTASVLRDALRRAEHADHAPVDVDDAAAPGSCVLMHPRGRASIRPIDQLRALFGSATASSPAAEP